MKKMQFFLLAAMIFAVGSAFTTAPTLTLDPLYKAVYSGSNFSWQQISVEGTCISNPSHYCEARFASAPADNQVPTSSELVSTGDFQ